MMKAVVCLMGPTASGKTQLAVELVKRFPFEIISVDSALVYRGMDIGTAKPDKDLLKKVPHGLIDICDPAETYSAAQFRKDACEKIEDIFSRYHIPLLVGGTMLYFKALQKGLSDLPSRAQPVRERINQVALEKGWPYLHEELARFDSLASSRIHPNDSQRIQRALEVYYLTGESLSSRQIQKEVFSRQFDFVNLAIAPLDRKILHARIAKRFKDMLSAGFIEEVRSLFQRGDLSLDLPSMRAVGYRQVWEFLQKEITYEEMEEKGIIATRQLAKRQLTWLRSWPDLTWFDSEEVNLVSDVSEFLNQHLL